MILLLLVIQRALRLALVLLLRVVGCCGRLSPLPEAHGLRAALDTCCCLKRVVVSGGRYRRKSHWRQARNVTEGSFGARATAQPHAKTHSVRACHTSGLANMKSTARAGAVVEARASAASGAGTYGQSTLCGRSEVRMSSAPVSTAARAERREEAGGAACVWRREALVDAWRTGRTREEQEVDDIQGWREARRPEQTARRANRARTIRSRRFSSNAAMMRAFLYVGFSSAMFSSIPPQYSSLDAPYTPPPAPVSTGASPHISPSSASAAPSPSTAALTMPPA